MGKTTLAKERVAFIDEFVLKGHCRSFLRTVGLGVTYRCMFFRHHGGPCSSPVFPQNPKRLNGRSVGYWVSWSKDA